jgi:N-acetyl-anhydromuramyl-L-alanine amidase AmpD
MAIGIGSIIGIGLKVVANRDRIAEAWNTIAPIIQDVRKNYPKIIDLLDDIAPGVTTPKAEPDSFSVEWLQASLNKIDKFGLEVDGDYGEATRAAVAEYQRMHPPLVVDGWAGVATQASIYEELSKRK